MIYGIVFTEREINKMKRKARQCIHDLTSYYFDITTDTDQNDFKKGYAYGIKVAIQVIIRIFKLEKETK